MENIEEKLVNLGYKLTKPRVKVLRFLRKTSSTPYSAQDIFKKIQGVDLASVYRVLALFNDLEIANEEFFGKEKKYCLATNPHHHVVCRRCGKTKMVECDHDYGNKFQNFSDIRHQLILTGICNKCK
ncbi:hypothetical protein COV56_01675 [Candidatus Kuenenbacteria bacterium CG11_big_fil_rev_8_21_14_0_20_37_9]|uniref:Transcriptional repressor n=2 Tax=Candidatus Kueneniibacteriota TaxID=1752740 RepID=A0A2M6XS18_9BACT|nr:MAG: hypothetical protein AUJ29_01330 [Candidatus Kuenenbacteria bacterium CG1_02_38_13]PIR05632.1 MAG: hypothetical protein COV56_01675 [Candidatus Kuenenbacteria bacterium CG11_big_fil_rev_8_21_14_0_20_37_9]PIU10423.1 MAG: hypothetical protein COT27_03195 [Candidatus Kuenenbacteria bacterium CG08_land_8_20_14_0_20_37_23]